MPHFYIDLNRFLKFTGFNRFLLIIILLFSTKIAISQNDIFVDVTSQQFPGLPQLINSTSGWADYDVDGRPDLLISGMSATNTPLSKLYHNTAKGFVDVSDLVPGLPQVYLGSVAWGDYNNDGKPDFFICGQNGSNRISKLYQNTGNGFVDKSSIVTGLVGFNYSTAAWGYWTNNRLPSLLVMGYIYDSTIYDARPATRLYVSDGDSVFENTILLPNVAQLVNGSISWADYDKDGFTDLTISGSDGNSSQTRVYHNDRGYDWQDRTYVIPGLTSLSNPSIAWIDFNKTGLPEFIMTGQDASGQPATEVYDNLSNHSFTKQSPGIIAVDSGSVAWGDYDNDGRPDLLISGSVNGTPTTKLYHNTQTGFVDVTGLLPDVPGLAGSAAAWCDYDKDGWPDLMITGDMINKVDILDLHYFGALYHNNGGNGFENRSIQLAEIAPKYQMGYGSVSWVQEDGFGYYDLVLNGDTEAPLNGNSTAPFSAYFVNNYYASIKGFGYDSVQWSQIPSLKNTSMDWADFNKDGLPDFMVIGKGKAENSSTSQLMMQIIGDRKYDHFNNVTNLLPGMPKLKRGCVKWGDYDNDGWPDLAVCGLDDNNISHTLIYHNEKGTSFTNVSSMFPNLPQIYDGSFAWGDYDNDGRADLLLSGSTSSNSGGKVTMLYHSEAGGFTDQSDLLPGLPQVGNSTVSFADVNNDGLPDILVTGADNSDPATPHTTLALYCNGINNITMIKDTTLFKGIKGFTNGSVAWGDYDDDGKTDIFFTGRGSSQATSALYHNTGYGFEDKSNILPFASKFSTAPMGIYGGTANFVDFDVDGRQDLFLSGENSLGTAYGSLWKSTNTNANKLLPGLQGIAYSSASWGDYDNDGKPDLFITGRLQNNSGCFTKLYHNQDSFFEDKTSLLPGLQPFDKSAVAWGDYDNDGRIDLFVMGSQISGVPFIKLYHNTDSGFADVSGLLPGLLQISNGSVAWADYDNDGKLDLIITGVDVNNKTATLLYHNKGNGFEGAGNWFTGLPYSSTGFGSVAWADYNNDGKPDFCITGINPLTGESVTSLYYNTGSGFAADAGWHWNNIPGLSNTAVAWGDYNNDGWIDLFITGQTSYDSVVTVLLRNFHGTLQVETGAFPSLPAVSNGTATWGDFDNDGWRDLILTGSDANSKPLIKFYHNTTYNQFEDVTLRWALGLPAVQNSSVAVADYDNDGKLDFIVSGDTGSGYSTMLYHNPFGSVSIPPAVPAGLNSTVSADGKSVTLKWNAVTDAETSAQGLNYNIYVATTSDGQDVLSPMADLKTGYRRVMQTGNSQTNSFTLNNLTPGTTYYWSVQAIDAAYTASAFAAVQNFSTDVIGDIPATIIDTITAKNEGQRNRIDWNTVNEEKGDWFKIEKSYRNSPFVAISNKVYAHGKPSSYFIYDPVALQGRNSYRIKTFNKKGSFTVSDTITVNVVSPDTCTLKVFPNPVHDLLNVTIDCSSRFGGVVSVINQSGKTVKRKCITGGQTVVSLAGLPNGIYYIQYNDGFTSERRKVVKL